MYKFRAIAEKLAEMTDVDLGPASQDSLEQLREWRCPESAIEFYSRFEPRDCVEVKARLWPIEHLVVENTMAVPGAYILPHGFVVFATTQFGDAYCFDTTQNGADGNCPIVLLSHSVFDEDSSEKMIRELAKPIAPSLEAFLLGFIEGKLDEECLYPPYN